MNAARDEITTEVRQLAARMLEHKRRIDWLVHSQARARGFNMGVIAYHIGQELKTERALFWLNADALGLSMKTIPELVIAARKLEAATR